VASLDKKLSIGDENYSAMVVKVGKLFPLKDLDKLMGTYVLGNQVIIKNDVKENDVKIYFPVECSLSTEYMKFNNLHKDRELNILNISGYFENHGRVRCIKFHGNKSEGLLMPLSSLDYIDPNIKNTLNVGDVFDRIDNHEICHKTQPVSSLKMYENNKNNLNLLEGQFKYHIDTPLFYRYLDNIKENDLISITRKMHGTSCISAKLLHVRKLKWYNKICKLFCGFKSPKKLYYSEVCSSRRTIRDIEGNSIWAIAHRKIRNIIKDGYTFYYEIVGYMPDDSGKLIQKAYDYSCQPKTFEIYVYRITYTNSQGHTIELPFKHVQEYCTIYGLKSVPELFYGRAIELIDKDSNFSDFFTNLKRIFLDNVKDTLCKNDVPIEGIVIRKESFKFEAYKIKSSEFM